MNQKLAIHGGAPVRDGLLPLIRVSVSEREWQQVRSVMNEGVFCSVFSQATKVKALEAAFAAYAGTKHAISFSSGTTAQHASLAVAGIGRGDEVIVPPLTFISTAYTVLMQGAEPVFADVERDTFNLDPQQVRQQITPRTKAVVPVHWFGQPVDMDALTALADERDLTIIEDCAHACGSTWHGRKTGTFGALACWSMQASKLITAAGEGGMLTTDDDRLARKARTIRDHGKAPAPPDDGRAYDVVTVGNNYRMTEMQAAFALAQLERIDQLQAQRREHSQYLNAALGPMPGLRHPRQREHVDTSYTYFPVCFDEERFHADLAQIVEALEAEGIEAYPIGRDELCHVHSLFVHHTGPGRVTYGLGAMPVAERISRELLLLPLYPDLTRRDLDDIAAAVGKVVHAFAG